MNCPETGEGKLKLFLFINDCAKYPLKALLNHLKHADTRIHSLLRQCFDVVSLGTQPSIVSADSGENEYLVLQRWQYIL